MPAAGASRRFGRGGSKLSEPLAGRTVLEVALQVFSQDSRCRGVALALAPEALAAPELRARLDARVLPVAGGARRCDSVLAGLAALAGAGAGEQDWVLVHDAARPCLSAGDLDRLLDAGAAHPVGALLAEPVTDTIKRSDGGANDEGTVDRSRLWRALTPQMFRYGPLGRALRAATEAGREPTDEAQAMEWQGERPLLVAAVDSNIKVTGPRDLELAAAIHALRAGQARPPGVAGAGACG
jgi:2-C-methyl-D-erythritol 4-phosphate cytidylyltransferase